MSQGDQLLELAATNLGVIEHLSLVFGPGMTAITGETGAGKTLVVTALDLLIGGRAEATMVGPHDDEAVVEGRFLHAGVELVLQRVIPRDGRSRLCQRPPGHGVDTVRTRNATCRAPRPTRPDSVDRLVRAARSSRPLRRR